MTQNTTLSAGATTRPPLFPGWLKRFAQFVVAVVIIWLMVVAALAAYIHHYGTVSTAHESDVIVVLGAGLRRDGSAGPALTRRSAQGAALYRQGIADTIICTGGLAPSRPRSEAEACREVLLRYGVPESAILLEERSRSTEENAIYTRDIMQDAGFNSAVVVSDSYHMLRSEFLFNQQGVEISLSPVPAGEIRGRMTYFYSIVREVLAFHWQIFKTVLGLPITHIP